MLTLRKWNGSKIKMTLVPCGFPQKHDFRGDIACEQARGTRGIRIVEGRGDVGHSSPSLFTRLPHPPTVSACSQARSDKTTS